MPWRVDVENRNLEIMVPPRQRIDGRVELVDIPKRVVVEPRHAAAAPEAKHGDRQGSAAQRCQRQDAHTPCSHAIQLLIYSCWFKFFQIILIYINNMKKVNVGGN